ncbi:hypothetical protein FLL45_15640 [Aliikangiella marina]|uniref:N-methyl-D-aspartate receptor NMDAR2C subunit n=1 Tax=Aliikangiella marina TaxID=1712262 RepID=A0A545T6P5_9GAMM|nr:hypothetical protein [Aliikangiella marina]TQV72897.1 hypothetical protein FLL45_15640 [Aliikangiella marina]
MLTEKRWRDLTEALNLSPCPDCFKAIQKAYSEGHRFYHTDQHINAMLKHLDATKSLAENPYELELAIWFHDAIYKPFSSTNELDSANWAKAFLNKENYIDAGIDRIYRLIMVTQHHGNAESNDESLMVDIDLTILGTSEEVYDEFEKNVRKEYKLVPWFVYKKKRKEILESFMSMPSVYRLDYFKSRYEDQARRNIARAIQVLSE